MKWTLPAVCVGLCIDRWVLPLHCRWGWNECECDGMTSAVGALSCWVWLMWVTTHSPWMNRDVSDCSQLILPGWTEMSVTAHNSFFLDEQRCQRLLTTHSSWMNKDVHNCSQFIFRKWIKMSIIAHNSFFLDEQTEMSVTAHTPMHVVCVP